jgi:hypothetical protein
MIAQKPSNNSKNGQNLQFPFHQFGIRRSQQFRVNGSCENIENIVSKTIVCSAANNGITYKNSHINYHVCILNQIALKSTKKIWILFIQKQ